MRTSFAYLPKKQVMELAQLLRKIVQAIYPEMIICYGHRSNISQDWSCFIYESRGVESIKSTYDLLIITREGEKYTDHEVIQMVEQQAEKLDCHATCIVHKLASVNESLKKGSRFFTTLYHHGILVYTKNDLPLAVPPDMPATTILKDKVKETWITTFTIAQLFFQSATNCLQNEWPEQTLFNLHQAVQHTCMAILRVFTGYRSTTHNLSVLLSLIENFDFHLTIIFPCITKEETDLFVLLNKAYSNARYNENFKVSIEKAQILTDRVKELLKVAEQLYKIKITALENNQPITFPLDIDNEKEKAL